MQAGGSTLSSVSRIAFVDSNGVSFGASTSNNGSITITATVKTDYQTSGNYLTTAMASDAGSRFVNTSAGLNLTNISATFNSNSISLSVANASNSSWTVSDANTSATVGRLAFTNANGLTLSLSTSNNGNHTVIGSYTVPTVTNSSFSVQDSATTINPVARIAFSTGNNITLSLSTGASSVTVGVAHNLAGTSTEREVIGCR